MIRTALLSTPTQHQVVWVLEIKSLFADDESGNLQWVGPIGSTPKEARDLACAMVSAIDLRECIPTYSDGVYVDEVISVAFGVEKGERFPLTYMLGVMPDAAREAYANAEVTIQMLLQGIQSLEGE